jgi:hypothetical protein
MAHVDDKQTMTDGSLKPEASEEAQTVEVSVGGETVQVKQAIVPTGIFPLPARVLRWAGMTHRPHSAQNIS